MAPRQYDMLEPRSKEWHIEVVRNDDEAWFEFQFNDERDKYYIYRVHVEEPLTVEEVLNGLRMDIRYDFIPPIFYTAPYTYKIRKHLGWRPGPFDFAQFLGQTPTPPPKRTA